MQLTSTIFGLLAAAASVFANSVTFISQDSTPRTIIFTPTVGFAAIPDLRVEGNGQARATFPQGWEGNWFSVSDGANPTPGMLGEVAFQGYQGITFFDVSAIVNPNDHDGVKEMFPAASKNPVSGCKTFPCDNAYYLPDDVQTKATNEVDLICTLGG